ncbi:hypothetical protein HUB98_07895 [Paenibacillus barcinonensis]|uniref:Uncharacterized protein n=1 Tax=Paenibacillus barcinonensis TaxID=198119 RepID=A0A2V4V014_PAEBA|nr:hypothetical protein [Paenibacillus barcinonensis]PYE45693.1 hypothetical protein DFQ00_11737 [Paenibacillus barcinonensis]QKS56271.1 hypothetical protein HUB98_07895 [Paenibacillus barcinonensis]
MKKEVEIAIRRNQQVMVRNTSGQTVTGFPERTADSSILSLRTVQGNVWIPLDEVEQVTRLLTLRSHHLGTMQLV